MKKILSLILAGLMTLSCAAFVAADEAAEAEVAEEVATFEDYALEFLVNKNIWKGVSAEELIADAESNVERWQMALLVSRISTGWLDDEAWEDDVANDSTFTDLAGTVAENYLGAISYANQNGIIEGYSAEKFGPTDFITYRDGLTMAVRTLGYKGLQYPWGYIEKAVELGLTEGIDKAYTHDLTRGEVACILYNALFAATKSGDTLAKTIFDVDFGWETIVLVADQSGYLKGFNSTTVHGDSVTGCPAGYVAFRILNNDNYATLSSETYYVKGKELGLDTVDARKAALGSAYIALFEIAEDGIVNMLDAESLLTKTVWSTENKKQIKFELMKYNLVQKLYDTPYISEADKPELMVFTNSGYEYLKKNTTLQKNIAMDLTTGHIYQRADAKSAWKIAWYYDPINHVYFKTYWDVKDNKIAFDYLDKTVFAEWYEKAVSKVTKAWGAVAELEADDCYAKLDMYDVNGDGTPDRANYYTYELIKICYDPKGCWNTADDFGLLIWAQLDSWADDRDKGVIEDNTVQPWVFPGVYSDMIKDVWGWNWPEGTDEYYTSNKYLDDFYGLTAIARLDSDAKLVDIAKIIEFDSEDEDNTIIEGMLKGYSIPKNNGTAKINLDGKIITLGYDALPGSIFGSFWDEEGNIDDHGKITAQWLNSLLWSRVRVTIVDGRVVDIDPCYTAYEDNAIIVLGFAGITAQDNLIAVYGYSIKDIYDALADGKDPAVKIYKISSFNGWKKGDYKYYPLNALEDIMFQAGCIYDIVQYNEDTDSYDVTVKTVEELQNATDAWVQSVTFERGYRMWVGDWATDAYASYEWGDYLQKQSATDKYLIIDADGTIKIYTGIVDHDDWKIENAGYAAMYASFNGNDELVDALHVFFTSEEFDSNVVGFENAYATDLVLFDENSYVLSYSYDADITDDALLGAGDYLLGSVQQTNVVVRNLLNGEYVTVACANNIDFEEGEVFIVTGNTIIGKYFGTELDAAHPEFYDAEDFLDTVKGLFWNSSEEEVAGDWDVNDRYLVFDGAYVEDATTGNLVYEALTLDPSQADMNGYVYDLLMGYYNFDKLNDWFYGNFFWHDYDEDDCCGVYEFNVDGAFASMDEVDHTRWAAAKEVVAIYDSWTGHWTLYVAE